MAHPEGLTLLEDIKAEKEQAIPYLCISRTYTIPQG